ncbi:2-succinyl-6-hydroxy-2,4-cyclohexadiene-1-carboxylate synthase [Photobacterium sanctipauli]|uniref:Putative 2-succinyl-6-hydroxy-2,4-cyclohexadiene-1-carboxylate synthase n=1 Tax=Photobacterium sanctipauli TaxID=1342794 RepID=A0A2T3NXI6_9GAMM|nr:2-succinyl-6-hydroxy-2,4-cyclohexadiene-1-carboxylate synthase [Photobacterium sanctipauli]PSW21007.1 2-succinyl-6-hydroxy-2,4-cyclohexadiene-1-carboxylate synthase [Photobacterium sanctipauli]
MPLYSETFGLTPPSDRLSQRPTLVFLHGLLGSGRDWREVVNYLSPDYPCLTIDLPGHGHSQFCNASGFEQTNEWLQQALAARGITHYVLVGYSLGARIAMYHACQLANVNATQSALSPQLVGLFVEGGNFGLPQAQREARWQNDIAWANRFAKEPIAEVLADWYLQAVFSSLNHDQRQGLIHKRSDNLGAAIAHMLQATSLAKQPLLKAELATLALAMPVHYVCGERDEKFKCLAEESGLDYSVIPEAGHNVHVEQPYAFFMTLKQYLLKNQQMEFNHA